MEKFFQIINSKFSFKFLFGLFQLHLFYIYIQCIDYNIIYFNEFNFKYLSFADYSNGDMIFSSTADLQTEKRIFYGFKKNGRPFFKNETSYFYSMSSPKKINSEQKFESDSLVIKLNDGSEKEYLLSTGNKESFCEIYDFEKNKIYKKSMEKFSNNNNYFGSFRNMGIFLFSNSSNHYYLFGFTIKEKNTFEINGMFGPQPIDITKEIYNLQIHKFNTIENFQSSSTYETEIKIDDANSEKDGISCFITKKKIIMCFYLTKSYYYIIAYNSDLEKINDMNFYDYSEDNSFYRCIHLKEEIGVFSYYKYYSGIFFPILLFKQFYSNQIIKYSIPEINLQKYLFDRYILKNDIIKLKEDKICFSSILNKDYYDPTIFIILINIFNDSKYKTRYYYIGYKINGYIRAHNYNNFISFAFSYVKYVGYNYQYYYFPALILFSYPNSTDNSSDLYEYLINNYNSTIDDFSVNLKNDVRIENNIFGYVFDSILIQNISNCLNPQLISSPSEKNIKSNTSLFEGELIKLKFIYNNYNSFNCNIEYIPVFTEPDLKTYDKFPQLIEGQNETDDDFKKEKYYGRLTYYSIYLSKNLSDNCTDVNCHFCLYENKSFCITYKKNYTDEPSTKEEKNSNEIIDSESVYLTEGTEKTNINSEYESDKKDSDAIDSTDVTKTKITIDIDKETFNTEKQNVKSDIDTKILDKNTNKIEITNIKNEETTQIDTDIDTNITPYIGIITVIDTVTNAGTDKDTFRDTDKDTFRNTDKDTVKDTDKDTVKNTDKDTIKDTDKDTIKDTDKDTIKDTDKDTVKDTDEVTVTGKEKDTDAETINNEIKSEIGNTNVITEEKTTEIGDEKETLNIDKNELIKNISNIIADIKIGRNYEISGDDFIMSIRPTNSSINSNSTHVDFSNCEKLLRSTHHIDESRIITFLQLEIMNKNDKSLVNQVEYQAYDDNKTLLDLSICNNEDIQIYYSIKQNSSFDLSSLSLFNELDIDILNIKDKFFTDICFPFSDNDNDIVLSDRIIDFYQNYSLCDDGCTYNKVDIKLMMINCNCSVKTNISTVEPMAKLEQLGDIEKSLAFEIIKCYNLFFSWKNKMKNYGFWIYLVFAIIHIPLLFIFFYKGFNKIKDYIFKEMENNGYISKNDKNDKTFKNIKKAKITKKNKKKKKKSKGKKSKKNNKDKAEQNLDSPPKKEKNIQIKKTKSKNKKKFTSLNNNSSTSKMPQSETEIMDEINKNAEKYTNIIDNKSIKKSKLKNKNFSLKKSKNISYMPTQIIPSNLKGNKLTKKLTIKKDNNILNLCLINYNLNLNQVNKYDSNGSNYILNIYSFEEAMKIDYRPLCRIFYIYLLAKQAFFHAFLYRSPLVLFPLRFCLLIFIISSDFGLNAIFYFDDKISEQYRNAKNIFIFALSKNITVILISTLIGFVFLTLFMKLSNSTNDIRSIFQKEEKLLKKNKKYTVTEKRKEEIFEEILNILKKYKIKVIVFFIIEILLLLFFWYYVTIFCHIYAMTQKSWILDSLLTMLSRLIIDLLLCLFYAKLYRVSVESNFNSIYKIALFFYCFC